MGVKTFLRNSPAILSKGIVSAMVTGLVGVGLGLVIHALAPALALKTVVIGFLAAAGATGFVYGTSTGYADAVTGRKGSGISKESKGSGISKVTPFVERSSDHGEKILKQRAEQAKEPRQVA